MPATVSACVQRSGALVNTALTMGAAVAVVLWLSGYGPRDVLLGGVTALAFTALSCLDLLERRIQAIQAQLAQHSAAIDRFGGGRPGG